MAILYISICFAKNNDLSLQGTGIPSITYGFLLDAAPYIADLRKPASDFH